MELHGQNSSDENVGCCDSGEEPVFLVMQCSDRDEEEEYQSAYVYGLSVNVLPYCCANHGQEQCILQELEVFLALFELVCGKFCDDDSCK